MVQPRFPAGRRGSRAGRGGPGSCEGAGKPLASGWCWRLAWRVSSTRRCWAAGCSARPTSCWSRRASATDGTRRLRAVQPALMDPVLQFQPWLEFNRAMIRQGRLPLWNPLRGVRRASPGQRPERGLRPVPPLRLPRHRPQGSGLDGRRAALGRPGWGCSCWRVRGAWAAGAAGSRGSSIPFCGFLIVWLLYPGHARGHLAALADPGDATACCDGRRAGRSGCLAAGGGGR